MQCQVKRDILEVADNGVGGAAQVPSLEPLRPTETALAILATPAGRLQQATAAASRRRINEVGVNDNAYPGHFRKQHQYAVEVIAAGGGQVHQDVGELALQLPIAERRPLAIYAQPWILAFGR